VKETKMKQVIVSTDLQAYYPKLPKAVRELLDRADKLHEYMRLGGKTPPNELRLFQHDWNEINNKVSALSDGKQSAATVTYRGRALIAKDAKPQHFGL
jgi:hypothetical protein